MRWRMRLVLVVAVLTIVGAISTLIAVGTPRADDAPSSEALRGLRPTAVEVPATPAPLGPLSAVDGGRPDCPQGWAVYHDPDAYFSLCYPPGWDATTGPPEAYFGASFTLRSPDASQTDSVYLRLHWSESSPYDSGVVSSRCAVREALWQEVEETAITLAGESVPACVGDVPDFEAPDPQPALFQGTYAEIALGAGEGYVRLLLIERKAGSETHAGLLASILESLQVGE